MNFFLLIVAEYCLAVSMSLSLSIVSLYLSALSLSLSPLSLSLSLSLYPSLSLLYFFYHFIISAIRESITDLYIQLLIAFFKLNLDLLYCLLNLYLSCLTPS